MNVVNNLPGAHELIPGINAEYIPAHPHNWILEILVETGWIGLALVVAILALLAWKITQRLRRRHAGGAATAGLFVAFWTMRSEEHTSELQSLMRISYAVFCLKKKKNTNNRTK